MTAYVISQVEPNDASFDDYRRQFPDTLEPFGGRVLFADAPNPLEGEWPAGRAVLIEFPDLDAATSWYHSDEYQRISAIRRSASTGRIAVIEGR